MYSFLLGINLADHSLIFSLITDRVRQHPAVRCLVVDLNPGKTASLKSLIENMVFNLVNNCGNDEVSETNFASILF